jgi:hypothetical protein
MEMRCKALFDSLLSIIYLKKVSFEYNMHRLDPHAYLNYTSHLVTVDNSLKLNLVHGTVS